MLWRNHRTIMVYYIPPESEQYSDQGSVGCRDNLVQVGLEHDGGIEEQFQRLPDSSSDLFIQRIDEMIGTDFLSLVGRTIFALNPIMDQSRNPADFANNAKFLRGTVGLFENISKFVPAPVLADRFKIQGVDW
ncbi:unnamed protein product [Rhizoctonia solani]|uniref:Uncharacterized protein n=1 Tax=Rhizoctonia solani TaxID=456999 RepID=A0A8H2XBE5_9AGAM|nr:unnamed protein product [Rhizoctonia solani]